MFPSLTPKSISTLAIVMLLGSPGVAGAADRGAKPASDVTGAIGAGTPAPAPAVDPPFVIRARDAQERFGGARAAMEHALLLRENAPKSDIATIETNMKGLLEDLDAVESTGFADSVKEARRLARAWHDSGMQILVPPTTGLTELPMPASVASKAEEAGTAIEWLVAETAAAKPPMPNAMAAATPAAAAAPLPVVEPKAAARMTPHHARHRAPAPAPMTQNEASARLLRDALPLFFPPAALLQRDDSAKR